MCTNTLCLLAQFFFVVPRVNLVLFIAKTCLLSNGQEPKLQQVHLLSGRPLQRLRQSGAVVSYSFSHVQPRTLVPRVSRLRASELVPPRAPFILEPR